MTCDAACYTLSTEEWPRRFINLGAAFLIEVTLGLVWNGVVTEADKIASFFRAFLNKVCYSEDILKNEGEFL